ncbi:MAG: histidine triad nucleotide-binding protein [Pirellulaceae bacterium]|nr:histidine triad nucleotide-binding protein [Planctomycetales bacterium]
MTKTIFSRIIDREVPAEILHEDDYCVAFRDVSPQAPVHVLLVPREPIPSIMAIDAAHAKIVGHMWTVVPKLAEQLGLDGGFRVVVNNGADGGQSVDHLHWHILGGRQMTWPPG